MKTDNIDLDYMKRFAHAYVWDKNKKLEFLNYMDRWIQRYDFRFPLDVRQLEEFTRMDQADIDSRYKPLYQRINSMPISDKEKAAQRDKIDELYLEESGKAALKDTAKGILEYLDSHPLEMIKALNKELYDIMVQEGETEYDDYYDPEFEILNWPISGIDSLTYEHRGKLKSITGWVGALENPPHIEYTEKYYICSSCGESMPYDIKPKTCSFCGQKPLQFTFDNVKSVGKLVQEVFVMQNYEDVTSTQTPGMASVFVEGHDINKFTIGSKIEVLGIVSSFQKKNNKYLGISALHCKILGDNEITISKEEENKIWEISRNPFSYIHKAFASSIVGPEYNIIKESLALSIVGGGQSAKRDKVHVLLLGNPGVGKSELLKAIKTDSPKGYYVSDASGPGLTAAITDINGSRVMVPGMLVFANGGVLCIDELDKMRKEDTVSLHSAMEQLQFTKSKAGITLTFLTATTVIAAANPINSIFDPRKTILEQINLPQSLLQRFDIVWAITGNQEINSYDILQNTESSDDPLIRKYFAYCARIQPDISGVMKQISAFFDNLRHTSGDTLINARTLLAMKRIVQASAKLHLREHANEEDLQTMERIFKEFLKQFNFSVTNIYMPESLREKVSRIMDLFKIQRIWARNELLHQSAMPEDEFDSAIDVLKRNSRIYEPLTGKYEVI